MPNFTFRLGPVLDLREQVERTAGQRLAEAQQEYNLRVELLTKTRYRLEEVMKPVPEAEEATVDVAAGLHLTLFLQFLTDRMEAQLENVARAGQLVEECRNNLVESRRDRLALEKLKEKKYSEYLAGVAVTEQKLSDELAQRRKIII